MEQEAFRLVPENPYLALSDEAVKVAYAARSERWKPVTARLFELWGEWVNREHAQEDLPHNTASGVFARLRIAELKGAREHLAPLVASGMTRLAGPQLLQAMDALEPDVALAARLIESDEQDLKLYKALEGYDTAWFREGPLIAQAEFVEKYNTDVLTLLRTRFPSAQVDAGAVDTLTTTVDNARAENKVLVQAQTTEVSPITPAEEGGRPLQKSLLDILAMNQARARLQESDETERA